MEFHVNHSRSTIGLELKSLRTLVSKTRDQQDLNVPDLYKDDNSVDIRSIGYMVGKDNVFTIVNVFCQVRQVFKTIWLSSTKLAKKM